MLAIELAVLCLVFFGMCYAGTGGDEKNIKSYASYPAEVQALVRENPALCGKIKTSGAAASFVSNLVLFGVVLFLFGLPVRDASFLQNFVRLSVLGQGLNLFDFVVIDLLWWRHAPRVRFTGTQDRPELYLDPKKHFVSFLKGILVFLIVAVADGLLLTLL